jgi:anthraniloyl-CoA monooxygenase
MKINIIGGGPAGMYFAILMKKADPSHEITVHERNGPDDTFGWGVVFSGKTLANLRAADDESHAEITRSFEAWNNVDVVHGDSKISIHGNSFSGISRLQLLKILQHRCEELGIILLFRKEVTDIESTARSEINTQPISIQPWMCALTVTSGMALTNYFTA